MSKTFTSVVMLALIGLVGAMPAVARDDAAEAAAKRAAEMLAPLSQDIQPAIPSSQRACSTSLISTTSTSYVGTGTTVTIDNGTATRNVILQFSTENQVQTAGNRIDLAYIIDGVTQIVGPEFFSIDSGNFATRTHMGVVTLGPGVHTIQAAYRTSNAASSASFWFRCLTAEGSTF